MLKPIDVNMVLSMVVNGKTPLAIAKDLQVGAQRIYQILVDNGYSNCISLPDKSTIDRIEELYKTGNCVNNIVKLLKIPKYAVTFSLQSRGIIAQTCFHYGRENKIDHHYFDVIDTERKAYWLGLWYADGSLEVDKCQMRMFLQSNERYLLEQLREDLQCQYKIYDIEVLLQSGKIGTYNALFFYSTDLIRALTNQGCPQNKSKIIVFPKTNIVPENLRRHFVRGYFDGDGSVYYYPEKNKYISPVSFNGTKSFCETLQSILVKDAKMKPGTIGYDHKGTWFLQTGGRQQAMKFMDYIYQDATIWMTRKRDIFDKVKNSLKQKTLPSAVGI